MACATCHVIVAAEDAARLPPPREEEEDLLDMVPQATRTSRLACQIRLSAALDGLTVRVPGDRASRIGDCTLMPALAGS
ncbi:hypothetical protein WR25_10903 [Diploscapter pachys]|uniref:Uncharacterized protein n=1 Tax=Diploscapter pachys TaxID=2018661 RepID=A0A2A2K8D7_9BILA|nr:hypothetical protein WR25_10903 [Diploscapter pachys]